MMPGPQHADPGGPISVARKQIASLRETPPPDLGNEIETISAPRKSLENTAEMQRVASSFQKLVVEKRTPGCSKNTPAVV